MFSHLYLSPHALTHTLPTLFTMPPFIRRNVRLRILSSFAILLVLLVRSATAVQEYKFNAGGYKLDTFQSDPVALISGDKAVYAATSPIPNLTVGLTHRWGSDTGFVYNFPTGNGQFDIDLIFAEIFPKAQAIGRRIFDIFVEDQLAIENIDVFASQGANVEWTRSVTNATVSDGALSIAFRKGSIENPMVSAIIFRASNGSDISIGNYTNPEGVSDNPSSEYDHQAHAIAGGPYRSTDYNVDNEAMVRIDGSLSHSHYFNPDTGESGRIMSYEWRINDTVVSTEKQFRRSFPIGETELLLIVQDQTGDTASATTTVTILHSRASGAYCYYYAGVEQLPASLYDEPKPDEGHSTNLIDFFRERFPYSQMVADDGTPKVWAARCITDFLSRNTTQYKFSVTYRGKGALLFVNGGMKASGGDTGDETQTINSDVTVGDESVPMEIWYYAGSKDPQLALLIDEEVALPSSLSYKKSEILPTISSLSTSDVQPQGGSQMQIFGTGFFNKVTVTIGNLNVSRRLISSGQLQVLEIPSALEATGQEASDGVPVVAYIVVSNVAGSSNVVNITYRTDAEKGVSWNLAFFTDSNGEMYTINQPTTVKVGPDSRYYFGGLLGYVTRLEVGKDLIVKSRCDSKAIESGRGILGMTFNYASQDIRAYVSTNTLFWTASSSGLNPETGWANGAVETFVDQSIGGCNECMCYEKKVITGLPVSAHDHGVNGLVFLNGALLIAVGGSTNAGIVDERLGGRPETPLSAAILIAPIGEAGFNGVITYDQLSDQANAKQTGGDVSVYATGFRNCFGLTVTSKGEVWGTDNGPNVGFGAISTGCDTQTELLERTEDELNFIVQGGYYGHPNRNRGECVYGAGTGPKKMAQSATTGIVEYLGNAFSGELQGDLILTKFRGEGTGLAWRATIGPEQSITLTEMTEYSGLAAELGLHGEIVMPNVKQGEIRVLQPRYVHDSTGPFVISVSPTRGRSGHRVFVSGENFSDGLTVKFGTADGTNVVVVDANGFFCAVPSGSGVVDVEVVVGGISSKGPDGSLGVGKFIYV